MQEFIKPNEDFQSSVNIGFDLGNVKKIESLIPTAAVCRYVQVLLEDVISKSGQRAKLLVGAYGKGKSHIALTALSALYMKTPDPFKKLTEAYSYNDPEYAQIFSEFIESGPKLLPVVISGNSTDLSRSFLYALRDALNDTGMEEVMPKTNYSDALETVLRWKNDYPDTYNRLQERLGVSGKRIESALRNFDATTYSLFVDNYPALTSGGTYDALQNADVIETYKTVLKAISAKGYAGIYVVYDEFSKYLESSISSASLDQIKLLQDFAEACNRSQQDQQLHLLLISHKNLSNYIDANLPKDKVDGWRGVSGRFVEIEIYDNGDQSYELMACAINKNKALWQVYLDSHEAELFEIESRYIARGLFDESGAEFAVFGCFPLHPTSAFLLPRISEIVAQNERTLFTFLSAREAKSLPSRAQAGDIQGAYVTPDYIYDYFEPLLRKEQKGSPAHSLYSLARKALLGLGDGCLESRVLKCVALVSLVSQFNQLPPTKDAIFSIYLDAGYSLEQVSDALDALVRQDSVVYLKRNNDYIKIKESSGVDIEEEIEREAQSLKTKRNIESILNDYQSGRALYPSRHNADYKITRYFDCLFKSEETLNALFSGRDKIQYEGDGAVVAVIPSKESTMSEIATQIKEHGKEYPTTVFVVPRNFRRIDEFAYGYAAALSLKDKAKNDDVLRDEYDIAIEDYAEILSSYIADFFWPDRKASQYFIEGVKKNSVFHRKKLSSLLSDLCDQVYCDTPIINNEVINKNAPTGIALTSRAKILSALCAKNLEPNLGFVGNGQETSIARSVLSVTGVVENFDSNPVLSPQKESSTVGKAVGKIEAFLRNANGQKLSDLYDKLTEPQFHIGAKRGPIPILLALVLREYRESLCIKKGSIECPIDKKTLEDIDASPEQFTVSRIDWDEDKAAYVYEVGEIFGNCAEGAGKEKVVEQARSWFVALPQFTRVSKIDHVKTEEEAFGSEHSALFKALSQPVVNANEFLFEILPKAFDCLSTSHSLTLKLRKEVRFCDDYIDLTVENIEKRIQPLFSDALSPQESLYSIILNWKESLSQAAMNHVFSGSGNRIMNALENFTPDASTSIKRLAKAVTSLRIEDWDDALYARFFLLLEEFVEEVQLFENDLSDNPGQGQSICFATKAGTTETRTFETIECSPRGRLLKNQIESSIEEMGHSISKDEMRQIVFDVLKELC